MFNRTASLTRPSGDQDSCGRTVSRRYSRAMSQWANGWRKRVMFERLGYGGELFDFSRPKSAVHVRLADRMRALGRNYDDDDITFRLVDTLLDEVLNAAEAVERAHQAVHAHAAEAQSNANKYFAEFPDMITPPEPQIGSHWNDEAVTAAWYSIIDVLLWARAFEDRLKRGGTRGDPEQGILVAIAPGDLRRGLLEAWSRFQSGHIKETRLLANYSTHAGVFMNPGTPSARATMVTGELIYELPDRVTASVDHWHEFRWTNRRDALTYVDHQWTEIITFVDAMLDAFALAVPERFRGT